MSVEQSVSAFSKKLNIELDQYEATISAYTEPELAKAWTSVVDSKKAFANRCGISLTTFSQWLVANGVPKNPNPASVNNNNAKGNKYASKNKPNYNRSLRYGNNAPVAKLSDWIETKPKVNAPTFKPVQAPKEEPIRKTKPAVKYSYLVRSYLLDPTQDRYDILEFKSESVTTVTYEMGKRNDIKHIIVLNADLDHEIIKMLLEECPDNDADWSIHVFGCFNTGAAFIERDQNIHSKLYLELVNKPWYHFIRTFTRSAKAPEDLISMTGTLLLCAVPDATIILCSVTTHDELIALSNQVRNNKMYLVLTYKAQKVAMTVGLLCGLLEKQVKSLMSKKDLKLHLTNTKVTHNGTPGFSLYDVYCMNARISKPLLERWLMEISDSNIDDFYITSTMRGFLEPVDQVGDY